MIARRNTEKGKALANGHVMLALMVLIFVAGGSRGAGVEYWAPQRGKLTERQRTVGNSRRSISNSYGGWWQK